MIVKMVAHPDQVRWWARSALNALDTLDTKTAIEIAKAELAALLAYLDRTDNAETVLGVRKVETRIGNELGEGQSQLSSRLEHASQHVTFIPNLNPDLVSHGLTKYLLKIEPPWRWRRLQRLRFALRRYGEWVLWGAHRPYLGLINPQTF
jgi:hypothetical protein